MNSSEGNCKKVLAQIFGRKYMDVVDRLKLQYIPRCVRDSEFCRQNHLNGQVKQILNCYRRQIELLYESDLYVSLLKLINGMILREEFPGEEVIFTIFQVILSADIKYESNCESKYIVDECFILMEKIYNKFPPCCYEVRKCYENVLTTPQNTKVYSVNDGTTSKQTLFEFALSMVNQIMSEESENESDDEKFNQSQSFNENWEENLSNKKPFSSLKRNIKLNRLFTIIYIITKLLELDLSTWILRNASKNIKDIMFNSEQRPLVASVFSFELHRFTTNEVKQILYIFIYMIAYKYPKNQIIIFSRLLTVVLVAVNLYDQFDFEQITYFSAGTEANEISRLIFKTIDENFGRRVEIYVAVIKNINVSFIRYLLIDKLLNKMNSDLGEMNVQKIIKNFKLKRWLQCSDELHENNDSIWPTNSKLHYYPIIETGNSKLKAKQSEIYRYEYLDILLDALKSYCDTYDLKNVLKLFTTNSCNLPNQHNNNVNKTDNTKIRKRKSARRYKYDLSKVAQNIKKYEAELDKNKLKKLPPSNFMDSFNNIVSIQIDSTNLKRLRNDIDSLLVLKDMISQLKEKYGDEFNNFNSFLEAIFNN